MLQTRRTLNLPLAFQEVSLDSVFGGLAYSRDDPPPGVYHGYFAQAQDLGHLGCQCWRGRWRVFFAWHEASSGEWPMHFLAANYAAQEWARAERFSAPRSVASEVWDSRGRFH